jgi:hypothetical protein
MLEFFKTTKLHDWYLVSVIDPKRHRCIEAS